MNNLFVSLGLILSMVVIPVSANAAAGDDVIVTTEPAGAVNDVEFTTQPVVEIQNAGVTDNTATDVITVAIASGSGTLSGTLTATAVAGVALFTDLKIVGSGAHTLTFTATGLTPATSASITPSVGVATQIAITTQPSGATTGTTFTTQPAISVKDSGGNIDTSDSSTVVTVAIATGSGTLSGTTTATVSSGIATFTDLVITGTGSHELTFTATGLTDDTTTSFTVSDVSAPAPAPVYIPTTPQTALVLTSSATTVEWGSQAKLTLTGGSGTGAVTYSSTGTTFCAVNPNGNLTPVSAGTCTVTATKDGDGTYGSAQSNSITITATDSLKPATSTAGSTVVVGKPVKGVSTVKFKVADVHAGKKVTVIQAVKSSTGKTIYTKLGTAVIDVKGAITFKTKAKLSTGSVLQLKHSSGDVIFSKSIN